MCRETKGEEFNHPSLSLSLLSSFLSFLSVRCDVCIKTSGDGAGRGEIGGVEEREWGGAGNRLNHRQLQHFVHNRFITTVQGPVPREGAAVTAKPLKHRAAVDSNPRRGAERGCSNHS